MILRRLRDLLLTGLGLIAAGYWFGSSGVGLGLLWLAARRSPRGGASGNAWRQMLTGERLTFCHIGVWRVLLVGEHGGRIEVFRDEVGPEDWAELRRVCLSAQPATGRSTSI